jgi:hypothetical protein
MWCNRVIKQSLRKMDKVPMAVMLSVQLELPSAQYGFGTCSFAVGTTSWADGEAIGIELVAVWQFWLVFFSFFLTFLVSRMDHFNSNYT